MTAQVQYFCDSQEERAVLDRLTAEQAVVVFSMDDWQLTELPNFSLEQLPPWPQSACLYLWAKDLGPLEWHDKRPELKGATHRSFVTRFFARQDWDESGAICTSRNRVSGIPS
jgi:hypothetical protein